MKKNLFMFLILAFPFVLSSQTVWFETDWSGGNYEALNNTRVEIAPGEVVLENETSDMVYAFSPTALAGVWDMEVFDGKLFIACCTSPMAIDDGEVISYDYGTNLFQHEYDVYEQGIIQMRVYGGKLYIPGVDSRGTWDWGNIYIYDGNTWERKETVPSAVHVIDLIFYQNEMYATTEVDADTGKATVFKSLDQGNSWEEVFSVYGEPEPLKEKFSMLSGIKDDQLEQMGASSRRFLFMGIYDEKLYVQGDLRQPEGRVLFCFDGSEWTTVQLDTMVFSYGSFKNYNNKLYFLNKNILHIFNGANWSSVLLPFSGGVIARSFVQYDGEFYSGAESGSLFKSTTGVNWTQEAVFGETEDEIESIAVYHGRLYVGTQSSLGKVFVTASRPSGSMISQKHDFGGQIESGILSWSALNQGTATSVKFQIKSANTSAGLDDVDFVGPDNTAGSYYENSGDAISAFHTGSRWMQYKVCLETFNSALMPVLQDVSIAVNFLPPSQMCISGKINYYSAGQPVNNTNLFLTGTTTDQEISDLNGLFEFANLLAGGNYTIMPLKEGDISSVTILGFDASLTAQIALNIISDPTSAQLIAADVDKNGFVQLYDAAMIARYSVGLAALPGTFVSDWIFDPVSHDYTGLNENIDDADFTAIVLGDVDGNWDYPWTDVKKINQEYIAKAFQHSVNSDSSQLVVVLSALPGEDVYSCNMEMKYNLDELKFYKAEKADSKDNIEIFYNDLPGGELKICCFGSEPVKTGIAFLKVIFQVLRPQSNKGQIEISNYRENSNPPLAGTIDYYYEKTTVKQKKFYEFFQNYPNPFNSSTNIEYSVNRPSFVQISIFNMLGQKVQTLVSEKKSTGTYRISWDGKDEHGKILPGGIFIYKMQSGGEMVSKKMLFLK